MEICLNLVLSIVSAHLDASHQPNHLIDSNTKTVIHLVLVFPIVKRAFGNIQLE